MRPGAIYCTVFIWNSTTGGRFIAPYLQIAHHLDNSSYVGAIIAFQFFTTSILSGWGGTTADNMERKFPMKGRIYVLICGITLGTISFLMENIDNYICNFVGGFGGYGRFKVIGDEDQRSFDNEEENLHLVIFFVWHFFWRQMYAISIALTAPVLDGLTIAHLKREAISKGTSHVTEENKFGRERLHGAIWWGIGNLIIGCSIDKWGFNSLCILSIMSTLACYSMIIFYHCAYVEASSSNSIDPESVRLLHNRQDIKQKYIIGHEQQDGLFIETDENSRGGLAQISREHDNMTGNGIVVTSVSFWSLLSLLVETPYSKGFFFAYFLLNVGFAVVENLIFLFYQTVLGSSYTMCGISVIFTIALEIPIFYTSPIMLEHLGPGRMLVLACAAFIVRTIGYVIVPAMGPVVFALDLFHGITYACSQAASVAYIAHIMPDSYEASGQGLLLLIRGMGGTIGLVLGGMAQEYIGARLLYATLGFIITCGMSTLIIVSLLFLEHA